MEQEAASFIEDAGISEESVEADTSVEEAAEEAAYAGEVTEPAGSNETGETRGDGDDDTVLERSVEAFGEASSVAGLEETSSATADDESEGAEDNRIGG
jgi:hypothetical protein